jgi:hypothetical protein
VFDIQQKKEEAITSSVKNNERPKAGESYPPKNPSRLAKTSPPPENRIEDVKTPNDKGAEFTQIIQIP